MRNLQVHFYHRILHSCTTGVHSTIQFRDNEELIELPEVIERYNSTTDRPHHTRLARARHSRRIDGPEGGEAACRFVEATGRPAMIGKLDDAAHLLRRERGTVIEPDPDARPAEPAAADRGA